MIRLLTGDCRQLLPTLPADSVHCVVTSPPYFGLRDYGVAGQLGLEPTPAEYVAELVAVFREVRRVLRPDGTCWLNLGDSYAASTKGTGGAGKGTIHGSAVHGDNGHQTFAPRRFELGNLKPKDLIGIPWRVAFALQADGWRLRSDIIWAKPNPMPESVRDRPTKAHEYLFLLAKSERYYFDAEAIAEPAGDIPSGNGFAGRQGGSKRVGPQSGGTGTDERWLPGGTRNARSVWTIATQPYAAAHFATFPPELAERCIKAGCPKGGTVLDPFSGAGTTLLVADRLGRNGIGIELNQQYAEMAERRVVDDAPLFAELVT